MRKKYYIQRCSNNVTKICKNKVNESARKYIEIDLNKSEAFKYLTKVNAGKFQLAYMSSLEC